MKTKLLLFGLIFMLNLNIYSQEYITSGALNYDKSKFNFDKTKNKSSDTLELPFIDDFSKTFPFQNTEYWIDNNVLITRTAAVLPPSIGAATFDAINFEGGYYATSYKTAHEADILTSKPINLNYPNDNTIFLSFFFQAQGITDQPEISDSLILQFYAPETQIWENVWFTLGSAQTEFQQIIIQVSDTKYLKKGFQFRFKNWVSLSSSTIPSLVGNCDFWYIDYVRLDKNRTSDDLIIPELAFQYNPSFKIDGYELVPYEHYKNYTVQNSFVHSYNMYYRNNDDISHLVDSVYFLFKEKENRVETTKLSCGSYNTNKLSNVKLKEDTIANFSFPTTDYNLLDFEIEAVIITNTADSTFNNRVSIDKPLSNFYAYDDGSAECGYGVYGDGSNQATVAAEFFTYKEDTLSGIQFYVNKTFNDEQPSYFNLMVWESDATSGLPGKVILEKESVKIITEHLYEFYTYNFDTIFSVSGKFFIGWRNITTDLLNVGLDLNATSDHKYFNIFGNWEESEISGEMLMRPVFAHSENPVTVVKKQEILLYPNPTTDYVKIKLFNFDSAENIQVEIYDVFGRKVFSDTDYDYSEISTSDFSEGVYIARIFENNILISTNKFIIKH